jgi:hypothetical protein
MKNGSCKPLPHGENIILKHCVFTQKIFGISKPLWDFERINVYLIITGLPQKITCCEHLMHNPLDQAMYV